MSKYVRHCEGLTDKGKLILIDTYEEILSEFTSDTDQYISAYLYDDEQYNHFQTTKSIKGITKVVTKNVLFDFDSKNNIELARADAVLAISRLQTASIPLSSIEMYFSGSKGFTVGVKLDRLITPEQHRNLAVNKFGKGLETLDTSIYNSSRIIRIPNSKHQESGLYKIPLSYYQLKNLSIDQIKVLAANPGTLVRIKPVSIDSSLLQEEKIIVSSVPVSNIEELKYTKPRHWLLYKWLLLHGVGLKAGERHQSVMVLGATVKALGYDKELAKAFLTQFDNKYAVVTQQTTDDGEIDKALDSIYHIDWKGGQYSIENNAWLKTYVQRLGLSPEKEETPFINTDDIFTTFTDFSKNFEKNLIKTGITELDNNSLFMTSTHNGVLGQPGSGKTSFSLQWLAHASQNNNNALFYSLDMGKPIVYGKLLQTISSLSFKEAVNRFKMDDKWAKEQHAKIKARWTDKVKFSFKSGMTIDQIKDDIKRQEDTTGEKTRLLLVDYLECLQGPYSDSVANTGYISNQLKDLANEMAICSVILLQTQKHSTPDISDPLLSMKQIKGSSVLEQSMSTILTMWREGYSPRTVQDDKFMSFAIVKNRFGSLWTDDFLWDGRLGLVHDINEEGRCNLEDLRKRKKDAKMSESGSDNGWK